MIFFLFLKINMLYSEFYYSSYSLFQVVASQDLYLTKYAALVRAQAHRQEIIQDLAKMVRYDFYQIENPLFPDSLFSL